ncbi:outer membrane protein [Bernardetia litoralis DSM 6794]|uniref:Outer membrane protein n=1 Tax=Bernardetia litoralis (strain ATCC 23117 / DSM 6794 / NBRC 15988 / NCIMB 1366 / Fx l1 / Sio-4) TaxID=880071 RepID=I4AN22_BERLS|nr:TolC family protein [Bernardetia litoralis]AFM05357.1 outer membrane protein [Bernardetia litoralis DSM 6794]
MHRFLTLFSVLFFAFLFGSQAKAQENTQTSSTKDLENYTLEQCIEYAIENRVEVKNAQLDYQISKAKVGEVRAQGLPQVNGSLSLIDNYKVPLTFLPAQLLDPQAGSDDFVAVAFQTQYAGTAKVELQQLVFSGSYILGLKAAATYTQLSEKQITQSKIEIAESVSKAYYSLLINRERLELLKQNFNRVDTVYQQTKALYENGFAEKIDADRLKVSSNNIKMEIQNFERLIELSEMLLKFQMGLVQEDNLTVSGSLEKLQIDESDVLIAQINPEQRIEFSLLQTQKELNLLQIREYKARYLPTLSFFANYGANMGSSEGKDLVPLASDRWIANGTMGISLNVPIFDSFQKHHLIQQEKFNLMKTENQISDFSRVVNLQVSQSNITLQNSIDKLKFQEENMDLAKEIFRVTKIKYEEGVGSNLEVVEAETAYKEAQTNYYSALYDAMVAKIDLQKAQGTLYTVTSEQ